MDNEKIKVLYIAGWGRSGSTILDNILGQIDGLFSVGELRYVWERNLLEDRLCSCGISFRKCGVWNAVFDEAFGGVDRTDVHEMLRLSQKARTRHLLLTVTPHSRQLLSSRLSKYLDRLESLYRAVQISTDSNVIVDSSKFPSYGYVLDMIPAIDLYIVHLVRDSRAVAYSWLRKKPQPDTANFGNMDRFNPVESSILWTGMNIATELFLQNSPERYMMLRYEDFIKKPRESIGRILDLVQEAARRLPFITEHKVKIDTNHSVSGNPVRFRTGTVELRLDKEWKTEMKQLDKILVTWLTWPMLVRYGYFRRSSQ